MSHVVMADFTDLDDVKKPVYRVGHPYPREGYEPTGKRVRSLETDENIRKQALILYYDSKSNKETLLKVASYKNIKVDQSITKAELLELLK